MTEEPKTELIEKSEFDKLQGKYDKAYSEMVDLKKQITTWTALGLSPDEIKGKLEDYDGLRKQSTGGDPVKIDDLVKAKEIEVRRAIQKELDEKQAAIDKLSSQNKEMRVVDKLFAMASPQLVSKQGAHQFFKEFVRKVADLDESGDIVIKDEKGEIRYSDKNKAQPMRAEEFVEWFINEHDYMAAATVSPNGGNLPNGEKVRTGGKTLTMRDLASLPSREQRKLLAEIGPEKIKQLEKGETIRI